MKDLKFVNGLDVNVTLRTDMISNSDQNFTVMSISNIDTDKERAMFQAFKRTQNTISAAKALATLYNLDLIMQNSDGSGKVLLVDGSASHSEVSGLLKLVSPEA